MTNHDPAPDMVETHAAVWEVIEAIASSQGMTPSGLAKASGRDGTSFNRSKRDNDGKLRWPSMGTVARVLAVAGLSHAEFGALIDAALQKRERG